MFKIYFQTDRKLQKEKWKMGIQEIVFLLIVTAAFLTLVYWSSSQELKFSWRIFVEPQVFWVFFNHGVKLSLRQRKWNIGPPINKNLNHLL